MNNKVLDDTFLLTSKDGRLQSIDHSDGRELKSFLFDSAGLLIELRLVNYRLIRTGGNQWTDGVQIFNIDISFKSNGSVIFTERSHGTTTTLNPDGSFVLRIGTQRQTFLHHNAIYPHRVDRILYPDGSERQFSCNTTGELTLIDECDGYWLKKHNLWVHYNLQNQQSGSHALTITVDYNGNIEFHFLDGTKMTVTAFGDWKYESSTLLAA